LPQSTQALQPQSLTAEDEPKVADSSPPTTGNQYIPNNSNPSTSQPTQPEPDYLKHNPFFLHNFPQNAGDDRKNLFAI